MRKSNKAFEAFVSQQERLPHISRKLEALLIVPIQRVPRYRLLLTELIAHTDQTEEEYTILNAALKQVEAVAHHINEQIREQENVQRMIRIQRSLAQGNPKIITPGRRLIKGIFDFVLQAQRIVCSKSVFCSLISVFRRKFEESFC